MSGSGVGIGGFGIGALFLGTAMPIGLVNSLMPDNFLSLLTSIVIFLLTF